jgi:hypothetical protein
MRCQRDNRLIEKRNRKICARFYYWTEVQRLRSDDALKQLSEEEFFLSVATILSILKKMHRLGDEELRRLAPLKKPAKIPRITSEMLSLFPEFK